MSNQPRAGSQEIAKVFLEAYHRSRAEWRLVAQAFEQDQLRQEIVSRVPADIVADYEGHTLSERLQIADETALALALGEAVDFALTQRMPPSS